MAAYRKKLVINVLTIIFTFMMIHSGLCVRTKNKIYIDLKTQSACFRNLNATHQVGCTSNINGNVGTVHYLQSEEDFDWVLSRGPHSPYVVLFNSQDFNGTSIRRILQHGSRVNGIMVINLFGNSTQLSYPPESFSSVDSCPNDKYGMYTNTTYKDCANVQWNPYGNSLYFQDFGIPVFALSDPDDVDAVLNKCYYPFNNRSESFPVCAAEVKARMNAVIDSVTCLRRSKRFSMSLSGSTVYCDPLGDKNVFVTMKDLSWNETRDNNSVILIGARMDSTSLFQNEYQAADTTVTGIVTLLATAQALWNVQDLIRNNSDSKDIMFTFFQGETFDYIGSSRMVFDMLKGTFPQEYPEDEEKEKKEKHYLHRINLTHLDHIVELNQVGLRDDEASLWTHVDPLGSKQFVHVKAKVDQLIRDLQAAGSNWNVSLRQTDPDQPLPPSSTQRFLRSSLDIPAVVITDHKHQFTNKFYNSHLDRAAYIDAAGYPVGMNETDKYNYITRQAELITNLSTALAHYLYNASTGQAPSQELALNLTADPLTVTHLLYCFLVSPICELFMETVKPDDVESLKKAKQPFPFYVSVSNHGLHEKEVTKFVHNILAFLTGHKVQLDKEHCNNDGHDMRYSYVWMQGDEHINKDGSIERKGWCIMSLVHKTDAESPAFIIDDYDMMSGEYSTWTESQWGSNAIGIRLFLQSSHQFQVSLLLVGLLMLVLSLGLVYLFQARSFIIFGNDVIGADSAYNPMS